MSWSLLHFKQYVQASLHTDIDLLLQHYFSIQQGGRPFFSLLMKQLVLSNEQSCEVFVSLVQSYNVFTNGNDDFIPVIKLLRYASKSIMAMRQGRKHLPDLYLKHMLTVVQTSSVLKFTHKIKQYDDTLEFNRYRTGDKSNNPKVLYKLFNFALGVHAEMRSLG